MVTGRRQRFVHGQVAWMLGTILILAALDALSLSVFFVCSLIGLLVVIELTAPFDVTPRWRARLRWVIFVGLVGFAYVVARRSLEILPSGVF